MRNKPLKYLQKVVPITGWLPRYTVQIALCDLIAGITVGLTLIPQSIAYASLAGLGPQYGLYSSLVGGFIYAIFGTVKDLNIAPTALVSLLTFSYTHDISYGAVPAAILLCFLTAIVEIVCGIFHLGFLVDFVSTPVVAGFTTAGSLTIIVSQFKSLLGLHFKAETFTKILYQLFINVQDTKLPDLYLGLCCCIFLISLREVKRFGSPPNFDPNSDEKKQHWFKTVIWFISVSRNAFIVIFCAAMAFILKGGDSVQFSLTSPVPQGLPDLVLPFVITNGNQTYGFMDATKELGTGIFVVPLVSILSNVALAKTFSNGKVVDASQEMLAMGLCNLFGSFLSSYPAMASFSRAAVNNASGARTTFGGIYTGAIVMLAITFLTPYFSYIPKPTLAAVIICALIYMIEYNLSKLIWKINKIDFVPLLVTLVACLAVSIEIGIMVGIFVDLLLVLYYTARPRIDMQSVKHANASLYLRVSFVGALVYSAAEHTRDTIIKASTESGDDFKYIIFDCAKLQKIDFTTAKCLDSLIKDLSKFNITMAFLNPKPAIESILSSCVKEHITFLDGEDELERFFEISESARSPQSGDKDKNCNHNAAFRADDEFEMTSVSGGID